MSLRALCACASAITGQPSVEETLVSPHGAEHQPVADEEVRLLLLEPNAPLNTGNITNERTVRQLERL